MSIWWPWTCSCVGPRSDVSDDETVECEDAVEAVDVSSAPVVAVDVSAVVVEAVEAMDVSAAPVAAPVPDLSKDLPLSPLSPLSSPSPLPHEPTDTIVPLPESKTTPADPLPRDMSWAAPVLTASVATSQEK
jgi:hypothetical protein